MQRVAVVRMAVVVIREATRPGPQADQLISGRGNDDERSRGVFGELVGAKQSED